MTKHDVNTRDKLIEVALNIFSLQGYEGASIRAIAEAAGVNVASINYHFGSKHNLYWAVMSYTHQVFKTKFESIAQSSDTLEHMITNIFEDTLKNPVLFKSTMKMMITDGVPEPDPQYYDPECEKGPPGADYIKQKICSELNKTVSPKDLDWAVRAMFGALMNWCMICTTTKMQLLQRNQKAPVTIKEVQQELLRTIKCIKNSL